MKKFFLFIVLVLTVGLTFGQYPYTTYNPKYYDQLNDKNFSELLLEDTSGNTFNTSSLKGKTVYVDFWFTLCPPCVKEIPFSKSLQQYFAADTNIVFVNICIENHQRKKNWKEMVRSKEMTGINLFYALNKPQKVNLLREYKITFPTYILVDTTMKVIGYDAPRPSEAGLVHWVLTEVAKGKSLAAAMKGANRSKEFFRFKEEMIEKISQSHP